jgi:hypothetical protein
VYAISFWLGSGEYKALPTGPNEATQKDTKVHEAVVLIKVTLMIILQRSFRGFELHLFRLLGKSRITKLTSY